MKKTLCMMMVLLGLGLFASTANAQYRVYGGGVRVGGVYGGVRVGGVYGGGVYRAPAVRYGYNYNFGVRVNNFYSPPMYAYGAYPNFYPNYNYWNNSNPFLIPGPIPNYYNPNYQYFGYNFFWTR